MKIGDKIEISVTTVLSGVGVLVARFPTASTFAEAFVAPTSQNVMKTIDEKDTIVCVLCAPDQRLKISDMFDASLLGGYGHGYASGGVWNPRAFRCDGRTVDYRHGSGWCITNAGFNRRVDEAFNSPPCGKTSWWGYVEHCNTRAVECGLTTDEIPDGNAEATVDHNWAI